MLALNSRRVCKPQGGTLAIVAQRGPLQLGSTANFAFGPTVADICALRVGAVPSVTSFAQSPLYRVQNFGAGELSGLSAFAPTDGYPGSTTPTGTPISVATGVYRSTSISGAKIETTSE